MADSTDFSTLRYDLADDGILTIWIDRPDSLNAFTVEMADELVAAFGRASADDAVRAVVVTGSGRAFCAGMDLGVGGNVFGLDESLQPTPQDLRERFDDEEIVRGVRDTGGRVTLSIFECRKPVIAAINGAAVGIGATMLCAMDVRMASTAARVGFVFGKIGIVPEAASTWFLPRIIGVPRALEWIYTADIMKTDELLEAGFVRSVHEPDDLLGAAYALARKFTAHRSPVGTALARQMIYRNSAQPHPVEAHRVDSLAMFWTSVGDGKEGVQAFLEKREPRFTGQASELPDVFGD